ncbi:AraC family transcriptional regulator [Actinomadura graeca]|uniref:AraC family transcriptional regulator n=1 Tax=Actinomadura graeca TaxID=2750812 RepID=A0ABX8R4R6_9ACTN|nr:helix-turn-helix domain-containing protein [Actinomadura graeca]QXJ26057.1 AraC family transcriptional regulator [Actinomadura graeca]
MGRSLPAGTRGILRARTGLERFRVERTAPPPELVPFIEFFWVLRWDLRGRPPHRQQVLTRPCVHMTFTSYLTGGTARARVAGVVRDEFVEEIADEGRVVGAGFRPGGFRPFLGAPVSRITGRFPGLEEVFGQAGGALAGRMAAASHPAGELELLEGFLTGQGHGPDPSAALAAEVVERIAASPGLIGVAGLAADTGMSARSLQRLFHEYVGIGPKWVIRRYRLLEAAERAASGTGVDWSALAAELGYADQAHLTRDFRAAVGTSPARYAREAGPGSIDA